MDDNGKKGRKRVKGLNLFRVKIKGGDFWRVSVPQVDGRRWAKTFKLEHQARAFYAAQCDLLKNGGRNGFKLADRQRQDAQTALEILATFGVTLPQAAEFYALSHQALVESQTVAHAIAKLLAAKKADGMSALYLKDLRNRLGRFALNFGQRAIASVTGSELSDWLRGLSLGPVSRNTFYLRLNVLFAFALGQRWVNANPLSRSMKAKVIGSEPGILSPAQFSALLEHAGAETLPYWAIGGFCGLRSAELERLEWADIDFERALVEVTRGKSKTASRRHVAIREGLLAWLRPYQGRSQGKVCPLNLRAKLEADRQRAGLLKGWPSNALRHSFASYHLEFFKNPGELTVELGHSDPELVYQYYRRRVRPDAAGAWWNIYPVREQKNVVEFAAL